MGSLMKKNILSLLLLTMVSGCYAQQLNIVNYEEKHKEAVLAIAFQDPYKFFCGSEAVTRGAMTAEHFLSENRNGMQAALASPLRITKVLLVDGKVAGFAAYYKSQELSLESMKAAAESRGLPLDENQILAVMPTIKRTDAECEKFALLESLAICQEQRGKGYGRMLLKHALAEIKASWPEVAIVKLDVNASNDVAKKLYESEGFVVSAIQPRHFANMKCVQYEKSLE